jgi:hypothetical protein
MISYFKKIKYPLLIGCVTVFSLTSCMKASKPSGQATTEKPASSATGAPITPEEGKQVLRESAKQQRLTWKNKTFEEFKAAVYKEPFKGGKYIVNGDTPILNEKQLREFFAEQIQKEPDPVTLQNPRGLIVNTKNGQDTIWNNTDQLLRKQKLWHPLRPSGFRHGRWGCSLVPSGGYRIRTRTVPGRELQRNYPRRRVRRESGQRQRRIPGAGIFS